MKAYLVFDIGGTKTAAAIYSPEGEELFYTRIMTMAEKGEKNLLSRLYDALREPLSRYEISHGCIASPGPLDPAAGKIIHIATMGWKNIPICADFKKKFHADFTLINDCSSGALGCYALNDFPRNMLYVSLSTGVGGGLILNNQLYEGKGNAAEIGHISVPGEGRKCLCGGVDCLELYASGSGISALYEEKTGKKYGAQQIAKLAYAGDALAKSLFAGISEKVVYALRQVEKVLDLDLIVFGGGLIPSSSLFMDNIFKGLKTECVLANNDDKQVIFGAYYYLKQRLGG